MIIRFTGPALAHQANKLGVDKGDLLRALAQLTGGEWLREPDRDVYEIHLKGPWKQP